MKRLFALVCALGSLLIANVAWAAPELQAPAKIDETQLTVVFLILLAVTIGVGILVWRAAPRGKKDDK